MNTINNCLMHELYQHTLERTMYLKKQGLGVVEMWECQWRELLAKNKDVKAFVDALNFVSPQSTQCVFWSAIHELFLGITLSCHLGR